MVRIPTADEVLDKELGEFLEDEGRLACPHCGQKARPYASYFGSAQTIDPVAAVSGARQENHPCFRLGIVICAACGEEAVFLRKWDFYERGRLGGLEAATGWHRRVYPVGRATRPFPNTPDLHAKPYREACVILELSPAASACMSRRCLQGLLSSQGYTQKDLVKQIDALLGETDGKKVLPASIHDAVDAIRQFGNFGAHPINDVTTLQLIEVDPGEAEWCVEVIEELFEHYFERPAKLADRLNAANSKVNAGGKPRLKS